MASLMNYVLVLGTAAICIYLIYRMIRKQYPDPTALDATISLPYNDKANAVQNIELTTIQNVGNGSGIKNASIPDTGSTHLRDFMIKSSYNSAFTGKYMNLGMVKYVISRGCRFLDFEVYIKDGYPIVAYTSAISDPSYTNFTSSGPAVSLSGVFSTIMANAFSDTAPNAKDPLFVQLHIKTNLKDAFDTIAQTIVSGLGNKLYKGRVTGDTLLQNLFGRVIIVVDRTTSPGYANYTTCGQGDVSCFALKDYVNMESGGEYLRIYRENELMNQTTNPPDPNVYILRTVLPNLGFFYGINNCDSLYLLQNYGAQMICQAFYYNDAKLTVYEDLFKTYHSAFVPIPSVLDYINSRGIGSA